MRRGHMRKTDRCSCAHLRWVPSPLMKIELIPVVCWITQDERPYEEYEECLEDLIRSMLPTARHWMKESAGTSCENRAIVLHSLHRLQKLILDQFLPTVVHGK